MLKVAVVDGQGGGIRSLLSQENVDITGIKEPLPHQVEELIKT